MIRVFIGKAEKGGNAQQESQILEKAARDLEGQLNDPQNRVSQIQGLLLNENPLHVEILAIAQISELPTPRKKGE